MFQWKIRKSVIASCPKEKIWQLWSDVSTWAKWDEQLEWVELDGPFAKGTSGRLKPKGWPVSKFTITAVEQMTSFSDETRMPATKISFVHTLLSENEGKTKITHEITARGLLTPLLYFTMRRKLANGLPLALKKLAELAENS